ncbi:DUF58 domain-containing protein [Diaphorobacter aerolatus]|uniref:DUF58 domain-containing protein n=2 Tax=Diaphorobacter aerolatus TaxID=1288495 RepID=A0A7H0GQ89_9BURK|nr:DUF58 domain-containing protein [Diaphorobacter aerolatus]
MRGAGIDLADLREYQTHDDVRHIDWNVTARLSTPHVRVFTEDRELTAWFLLDLSPSVDFGPPGHSKRDQLTGFVGVLARLFTRRGNRVGAVLHAGAGRDRTLPARSSRAHVLQLLHLLMGNNAARQRPAEKTAQGTTQLHHLLESAQGLLRRRSTVFLVSDFMSDPGWERPLAQLAQRHDVVAVRLLDPLELALPDIGLVWMRDPETGERLHVDTRSSGFRKRYARLAAEREEQLRANLARAGVDTLELATDDDLLDSMMRFLALRGLRSAQPARLANSRH